MGRLRTERPRTRQPNRLGRKCFGSHRLTRQQSPRRRPPAVTKHPAGFKPSSTWRHPSDCTDGASTPMAAVAIVEAQSGPIGGSDTDVARAAAGDRRAFERVYRIHVNRVFSLCTRMTGDRARAEELTQDVF